MRKLMGAVAGMLIALAAPAAAQQSGTVSFSVGGVDFTAPMPAGYCAPTGDRIESAQAAAALDKNNVTNLTLDSCGPAADPADYLIVKTPVDLVSTPMRLRDLLRDPGFARPSEPEAPPETERRMEAAASAKRGEPVDLSGGVAALGHDAVCGYLGGTIAVAATGATDYFSLGGCMTVVGERVLTVFFYARGNDPAIVTRLRAKARAFALSISVRKE